MAGVGVDLQKGVSRRRKGRSKKKGKLVKLEGEKILQYLQSYFDFLVLFSEGLSFTQETYPQVILFSNLSLFSKISWGSLRSTQGVTM